MSGNYPDGVTFDEAHNEMDDEPSHHEMCPRCNCCELMYVDCETCGSEGVVDHDCGEDTCCCLEPWDNVDCEICQGTGGWQECLGRCNSDGKHAKKEDDE